jgi:hypothetical protein
LEDKYPQAPITAASKIMKDTIIEINNSEDEKNDLITMHNIKISEYVHIYKEEKEERYDCREFIMMVINKAINVTR